MEYFKPPPPLAEHDFKSWTLWKQQFQIYLKASDKERSNEDIKIAILLSCLGHQCLDIYNAFKDYEKDTLNNLLKAYDAYFLSKNKILMETLKFNNLIQTEDHSIEQYLIQLREQAKLCDFVCKAENCNASYEERMIRDRLIAGLRDKEIQAMLIREDKLDLNKIVDYCAPTTLKEEHLNNLNPVNEVYPVKNEEFTIKEENRAERSQNRIGDDVEERTVKYEPKDDEECELYMNECESDMKYDEPWYELLTVDDNGDDFELDSDSSGTSNHKSVKSTFVKQFENQSRLNETETSTEASDVLEIPEIKEEPLQDDIDTVLNLNIVCTFSLCQLHSILSRSTIPRKDELEKIKELNLEVKHGSFSKEEDKMILNNWKTFCEVYKLTVNPSLFLTFPRKMKMSNKTNFLRYLAHGLNNRMLHSVHARFKNLLSGPRIKSGRFTEEEDRTIMNYMGRMETKTPFCDLAKLLNRNKVAIVKRYSLLKIDKNHQTVVRWTPEMVDVFVSRMKEVTKCDKLKQLKHRKLTEMEWKRLSKKMDNIPYSKLQRAWHHTIYPRLFAKDVDRNILKLIKVDIIHNLRERGVTDWKLVNWKEVADDYDGFTPEKIYMMFKKTVCYHVPEAKQANLKDCLDFLENVLKHGQISTAHKFQKFAYKGGHIVAKYD